jgi:hypothetical protein
MAFCNASLRVVYDREAGKEVRIVWVAVGTEVQFAALRRFQAEAVMRVTGDGHPSAAVLFC